MLDLSMIRSRSMRQVRSIALMTDSATCKTVYNVLWGDYFHAQQLRQKFFSIEELSRNLKGRPERVESYVCRPCSVVDISPSGCQRDVDGRYRHPGLSR